MSRIIFIAIFLLSLTHSAWAICLDEKEASIVTSQFNFSQRIDENLKIIPSKDIDLCDEKDIKYKTVEALVYLNKQDDRFEKSALFTNGAYNFLTTRITNIIFESEKECNSSETIAYVVRSEKRTMHICPLMNLTTSKVENASVLLHESRHTDGDIHRHVDCNQGGLKGLESGCDENIKSLGSYGVGAIFLLDLYESANDKVEKQGLRSLALTELFSRFNTLPLDLKAGIAVQAQSGEFSFFDGKNKTKILKTEGSTIMTDRALLPVFYNNMGSVKSYSYSATLEDTPGSFAKDFRESFSDDDRQKILDVAYDISYSYSCMLFTEKLTCYGYDKDNPKIELVFTEIRPLKFMFNHYSNRLYIVNAKGSLYVLPTTAKELNNTTEADLLKNAITRPLTSIAYIGKAGLKVDLKGVLHMTPDTDSTNPTWSETSEYKKEKIKNIFSPFVWSQKLHDL